jgi:hypothetical protein
VVRPFVAGEVIAEALGQLPSGATVELVGERDAIPSMKAASEKELPVDVGVDPCQTPLACAVVPESMTSEKEPTSRDLLLDDRVERLTKEIYLLLKERKELREIALIRAEACNERLFQMREAKRVVRAYLAELDACANDPTRIAPADFRDKLREWAAKPI